MSGQHLLALINSILDLSKIEAGHIDVSAGEIGLGAVLEQCVRTVEPLIKAERVALVREFIADAARLTTDEEKLRQIVINLLSNAAKFTDRGTIRVSATAANGAVAIAVSDTGIGIRGGQARADLRGVRAGRHQQHARLWRHRLGPGHRAAARTADGRRHPANSALGQGLDLHADLAAALPRSGRCMKTILIVEDVALNRDLLVQLLEERYRLLLAEDGLDALGRAAAAEPDLILMDLSLPRLDGWEATRRLKADPALARIPVVALSAHAMRGDEERARATGCDDFLTKPIDEDMLFGTLERHLGA